MSNYDYEATIVGLYIKYMPFEMVGRLWQDWMLTVVLHVVLNHYGSTEIARDSLK